MDEAICFDASVFIKVLLEEPDSEKAHSLMSDAAAHGRSIVDPAFARAEVISVLRGKVFRGESTTTEADRAVATFLGLGVVYVDNAEVYRQAWQIATDLRLSVIYDAAYLAVAMANGAPYWTADSAFYERAKDSYPAVRLLGSTPC